VDVLRPRAVPPLVLLALCAGAFAADPGCGAIDGTYRNADTKDPPVRYLDFYVRTPSGRLDPNLVSAEDSPDGGRLKVTHKSASATLATKPDGLSIEFRDDKGSVLATHFMNFPRRWTCKGGQYQWEDESYHGLGSNTALVKTRGFLARSPADELVLTEDRDDPREQVIKRAEVRFAPVK